MAFFEIKNYNKTFPDGFRVLNNINFSLEKGEVLSIIGSSGSGKTTLLRAINFLGVPDDGEMWLDGDILFDGKQKYNEKALRQKRLNFGLVFQSFNLFPQYTVFKNLTLAPTLLIKERAKENKRAFKDRKARIDWINEKKAQINDECVALLERVGLSEKANSYPCELSGGQCQRVAIARALALKPKILCFDEPTSALDPELTGEVLKVIKSLKGEDRTMIIVTHEMSFAKKVSDKVIFMSEGKIIEQGSAKEIFDNPQDEKLKSFLSSVHNKDI
ncbi:MAG: amino acid ABC transporter ATP-binding protein [Clostridia bacterium]|nr:amino acid ABC transporter ATP-binding protein [Clostridia bacterium]